MAREKGDPTRLIARLKAALETARPRDTANAELMAQIAGMTWRNLLKTHIEPDADFPILARGAEGVAWEFNVRAVLRHMIKRADERIAHNVRRAKDQARLTGFIVPDEDLGLDIAQLRHQQVMTFDLIDRMAASGELVSRTEVTAQFAGVLQHLRDFTVGLTTQRDPEGKWPPERRRQHEDDCRAIALEIHKAAEKFLSRRHEDIQPKRNRRAH